MAQAAVESALNGDSLLIRRQSAAPRMKRKTPSELRGEQLKRHANEKPPNDQLSSSAAFDRSSNGNRNAEQQKISKFVSTRVTQMFPVKKPRNIGKENLKDAVQNNEKVAKAIDATTASNFASSSLPRGRGDSAKLDSAVPSITEAAKPGFKKVEKCSENALRSVSELHVGDEMQTGSDKFDMEKALKGFGARDASVASGLNVSNVQVGDAAVKSSDMRPSKISIPGNKAPLDFTLKTTLQFVSSSSVKWCHKLSTNFGRSNITGAIAQNCHREQISECSRPENKKEFLLSRALQSWVYPQSLLPSSIISAMLSSTARGENDFLLKRHQDWEDSFQNLYYMLRKNMLNIFYVYTAHFVALFVAGGCSEKKKSCSAYLSQSTRGIRSLLRKHGICFSMPLCNAEVEQATEDDLIELSEIQRRNLGQALHIDALSDVDNTAQSLLQFTGNESVHGLYDILLNYRNLLNSLPASDVPALYSPQPFQNGCLHIPEVKCREMRKADMGLFSSGGFDTDLGSALPSSGNICYSMEIKDAVLPPWVVSGICSAMSVDTRSFDLRISSEPLSMGLNVALKSMSMNAQPGVPAPSDSCALLGIPDAVLVPSLHSASVRRLSYTDGEYVAYTTV